MSWDITIQKRTYGFGVLRGFLESGWLVGFGWFFGFLCVLF